MNSRRQEEIKRIIGAKRIATQQELAAELERRGIGTTQSSVSRDIVRLGLTKMNGYYTLPQRAVSAAGLILEIAPAGDNLIIVKTDPGQASPAALAIDRAGIDEVVGTVAGDDTLFVAVKDPAAQRTALKKIVAIFAPAPARPARKRPIQPAA